MSDDPCITLGRKIAPCRECGRLGGYSCAAGYTPYFSRDANWNTVQPSPCYRCKATGADPSALEAIRAFQLRVQHARDIARDHAIRAEMSTCKFHGPYTGETTGCCLHRALAEEDSDGQHRTP